MHNSSVIIKIKTTKMLHFKNIQEFNNSVGHKLCSPEKPRKKPVQKERSIQIQIVNYLTDIGVVRFAVPNGGSRNASEGVNLKREGVLAGVSDIVALLPNAKTIFLEVKTDIGKQSDNQKLFQKKVEGLGFDYYIVRSLNEAKTIIGKVKAE